MRPFSRLIIASLTLLHAAAWSAESKPIRALLIAGGCCHDYARQKEILKKGLEERANLQVDIIYTPDGSTSARFAIYEKADWAKGYDVIIHDDCTSDVKETNYVRNILEAHKTIPAVNLHCAMHSYRVESDEWFRFVGIQSSAHGPQEPIAIHFVDSEHFITRGMKDWTTVREELYNNIKVFETAHPLARGKQAVRRATGRVEEVEYVVAWLNQSGNVRVFSTTLGHNNDTVQDPRYLDLVTRGLLWACNRQNDLKSTGPKN